MTGGTGTGRPTGVRWRILGWIVLASFVAYVLRFNMSVAGPVMMKDLGLSEVQFGIVLAAFAWSYGLFQMPGGLLGERLGPRRAMTLLFVAWGAVTVVTAAVPSGWPIAASLAGLVVIRAAQGLAQAPLYPVTSGGSMFAWFPPRSWAFANSLSTAGSALGATAAGPAVAWLVASVGWRQSFLLTSPLALVLALVWWWDYRDDPAERRGVNRAELELIDADRSAVVHPTPVRWTRLLADRDLLFVTLSYFCLNYVFYLFFNWFYYYLTEVRGLPASSAGLFTGAQWMVGTLAALAGGLVCDRLTARFGARIGCRVTAIGGLLLSAPLLVAGTVAQEPLLCVTLLSLSFGSVQFTDGAYWAATMRMAGPQAQTATGVLNTGGNVVGGIGAMLVPAIAGSLGWTMAVASGAVLSVVAALLWFGVRPDLTMQSRTAGAA